MLNASKYTIAIAILFAMVVLGLVAYLIGGISLNFVILFLVALTFIVVVPFFILKRSKD